MADREGKRGRKTVAGKSSWVVGGCDGRTVVAVVVGFRRRLVVVKGRRLGGMSRRLGGMGRRLGGMGRRRLGSRST